MRRLARSLGTTICGAALLTAAPETGHEGAFPEGGRAEAALQTAGARSAREPQEERLDEAQRSEALALIKMVDAAAAGNMPTTPAMRWENHVLKAAEGMAYVPFTVTMDRRLEASQSIALYLRIAGRGEAARAEKSAIRRWLALGGDRRMPPRMFDAVFIPPEEMPVGGPAMLSGRRGSVEVAASSAALALVARQSQRDTDPPKQTTEAGRKEDDFVHPFEDIGFIKPETAAGEPTRIRRAAMVPPGEYDVYLAVGERGAGGKDVLSSVTILKHPITVPDWGNELRLSSVIVADKMAALPTPYVGRQQSEHPYALGWIELQPVSDRAFTTDEALSVVFQICNPSPGDAGKPDVTVAYSFFNRQKDAAPFAVTAAQKFNAMSLPPQFDLGGGHQLFATQSVPLESFVPGDYRLEIEVTDNRTGKSVVHDEAFSVLGSTAELAGIEPVSRAVQRMGLIPAFRREDALDPALVGLFLDRLMEALDAGAAAAMTPAIGQARAGRYARLLDELSDVKPEGPGPPFLRGLALLALGDNPEAAAAQFQASLARASDFLPAGFYLGACYAARGLDRQATAAWQMLLVSEIDVPVVYTMLADAYLRLGEGGQALDVLGEARERLRDKEDAADALAKRLAAAYVLAGRDADALALLAPYLERHPADTEALFLAIRLIYYGYATGVASGSSLESRDRLTRYARAYGAANGPRQALVEQWMKSLERR